MSFEPNKIDWANALLESIAKKIQLNKADYEKAVGRYHLIAEHLSEMYAGTFGKEPVIYPQGSFRIRSTVASYRDDDYDIDLILEIATDPDSNPDDILDLVHDAMVEGQGKLKYGKVEKKRRCVRLRYEGMHIDITPGVLINPANPRVISIFDSHPQRSDHAIANPEGFAQWFDLAVLPQNELAKRTVQAQTFPVPDQEPLEQKPDRILSLQLLKRFRDIACDAGDYDRCPSVLIAKLTAEAPTVSRGGLIADLKSCACYIRDELDVDDPYEENPRCEQDLFTDRWPEATQAHKLLARDLNNLSNRLDALVEAGTLREKQDILISLFGERATKAAFTEVSDNFAKRSASESLSVSTTTGAIGVGMHTPAAAKSLPVKPHKFFGSEDI